MPIITNKYSRIYKSLVEKRLKNPPEGFVEKHHILPKSLGGSNAISNIVKLTPREHYICHKLLVRMTEGAARNKMVRAAWFMTHLLSYKDKTSLTSKQFEALRIDYAMSARLVATGKKASTETKAKMSKARIGKPKSEITKHRMTEARNNRGDLSRQAYENLSKAKSGENNPMFGKRGDETSMFGKHHSDETKEKMAAYILGTTWWYNETTSKRFLADPGVGWVRGRGKKV